MSGEHVQHILGHLSEQFGVTHERGGLSIGGQRYPVAFAAIDHDHGDDSYTASYSIPDEKGNLYDLELEGSPEGAHDATWKNHYAPPEGDQNLFVGRATSWNGGTHQDTLNDFAENYRNGEPANPGRASLNADVMRSATPGRVEYQAYGGGRKMPDPWQSHDFVTGQHLGQADD